jgi:hypothetical protein
LLIVLSPAKRLDFTEADPALPASERRFRDDTASLSKTARARTVAELRRRCAAPEADALTALLGRAALHGAPLGAPLGGLAAGLRAERARRGRERAATSAPKIQLVVALLLVPAALLVVAAGLLAQGGA